MMPLSIVALVFWLQLHALFQVLGASFSITWEMSVVDGLSLSCWGVIVFLMHILFKRMHLLVLCQEVSQHTSIPLPSPSCILGENNFWSRFLMWLIPPNLHQYTDHDTGNEYCVSVLLLSCQEHVYQMFMEFSPISASPDTQVSLSKDFRDDCSYFSENQQRLWLQHESGDVHEKFGTRRHFLLSSRRLYIIRYVIFAHKQKHLDLMFFSSASMLI